MKTKRILACLLAIAIAFCFTLLPATGVFADSAENEICQGAGGAASGSSCAAPSGSPTVDNVFATIINVFSAIIGAVAVIMLIYGGFQLTIGGEDPGKVKTGRSIIIYALVGLVVVGAAQILVQFVLTKLG
jgi:hypothetical protein